MTDDTARQILQELKKISMILADRNLIAYADMMKEKGIPVREITEEFREIFDEDFYRNCKGYEMEKR